MVNKEYKKDHKVFNLARPTLKHRFYSPRMVQTYGDNFRDKFTLHKGIKLNKNLAHHIPNTKDETYMFWARLPTSKAWLLCKLYSMGSSSHLKLSPYVNYTQWIARHKHQKTLLSKDHSPIIHRFSLSMFYNQNNK